MDNGLSFDNVLKLLVMGCYSPRVMHPPMSYKLFRSLWPLKYVTASAILQEFLKTMVALYVSTIFRINVFTRC